jgi:hypothetical protein
MFFLDIGKFDLLPTDLLFDRHIFGQLKKANPHFEAVGYESHALFQLMGSLIYFAILHLVQFIVLCLSTCCMKRRYPKSKKTKWLKKKYSQYNLQFYAEILDNLYLQLNIVCFINIKNNGKNIFGSLEEDLVVSIGDSIAPILLLVLFAAVIVLIRHVYKLKSQLI